MGDNWDDGLIEEPFEADEEASDEASHRRAFGEFGGESRGLIDRAFRERIVLAGVALGRDDQEEVDASMDELARLVDTAGADPVARVLQRRDAPDIATYVGSGKAAINGCVFLRPESGEPLDSRGLELLRGLCESYARAADSAASSLMDEAEV